MNFPTQVSIMKICNFFFSLHLQAGGCGASSLLGSMTCPPLYCQTSMFGICRQQLANEKCPAVDNILLKAVNIRPKTQRIMSHKLKGRCKTKQETNALLCTSKSGNRDILSKQQITSMEKYLQRGKCATSIIRIRFIPV